MGALGRQVPLADIDPRYYDSPSYVVPNDKVGQDAFAVIREAMRDNEVRKEDEYFSDIPDVKVSSAACGTSHNAKCSRSPAGANNHDASITFNPSRAGQSTTGK